MNRLFSEKIGVDIAGLYTVSVVVRYSYVLCRCPLLSPVYKGVRVGPKQKLLYRTTGPQCTVSALIYSINSQQGKKSSTSSELRDREHSFLNETSKVGLHVDSHSNREVCGVLLPLYCAGNPGGMCLGVILDWKAIPTGTICQYSEPPAVGSPSRNGIVDTEQKRSSHQERYLAGGQPWNALYLRLRRHVDVPCSGGSIRAERRWLASFG